MNQNERIFLGKVIEDCIKNRVTINLVYDRLIVDDIDNTKNSGSFGGSVGDLSLNVACKMKKKDWMATLIHEYGHLLQRKRQTPAHKAVSSLRTKTGNAVDTYFTWLDKTDFKKDDVERSMRLVRNMELENEKLSVTLIKKYNLPIDITWYIKSANAYLYFYRFTVMTRTWFKKKAPYSVKKIVDMMPDKFLESDDYDILPDKYFQIVQKRCL